MSDHQPPELVSLDDVDARPHAHLFDEPRTIRLALDAGESIAPHQHPGKRIVFHLLDGRLSVTLGPETYELAAGDVAAFDGDQDIAPEAIEDSVAIIVLTDRSD